MKNIENRIVLRLERLGERFIGRTEELKRIEECILAGGVRAVLLHGVDGTGKTVTASRTTETLMEHFDYVYTFDCRGGLGMEEMLVDLANFFKTNDVGEFDNVVRSRMPLSLKLEFMAQVLAGVRLLLVFDEFDPLLQKGERDYEVGDPALRDGLKAFVEKCSRGTRFIFTCRNPFSLLDGNEKDKIEATELGGMSETDAVKLMKRYPVLAGEAPGTMAEVIQKTGSRPFALRLFGRHALRTSVEKTLAAIADVDGVAAQRRLLTLTVEGLSAHARTMLERSAVFRKAVPLSGLRRLMSDAKSDGEITGALDELLEKGLIVKVNGNGAPTFRMHTLVRDFIRDNADVTDWKAWLAKAAGFYEEYARENRAIFHMIDAHTLYHEAGEFQKAGEIVAEITEPLHVFGLVELARTLNELTVETAHGAAKAAGLHHLGIFLQEKGEFEKAADKYAESLRIYESMDDRKGIASTLHNLAAIHQARGDYGKATEQYIESLLIKEDIGDQRGAASTLHQLGTILQHQGSLDEALEKYNRSIDIKEQLGDRLGIAVTLAQTGSLYKAKSDYRSAVRNLVISLAMFESLKSPYKKQALEGLKEIEDAMGEKEFRKLNEEVMAELESMKK